MKALVIAEHPEAARELAAGARTLADEVALVAFGEAPENVADAAYIVEVPEGAVADDAYLTIQSVYEKEQPAVVLAEPTRHVKSVLGRLAAAAGAAAITDVTAFEDGGALSLYFGGVGERVRKATGDVAFYTVAPGTFADAEPAGSAVAETVAWIAPARSLRLVSSREREKGGADLFKAEAVVACGRGFAEESELDLARALADKIDGGLACSRPLTEGVDWMPASRSRRRCMWPAVFPARCSTWWAATAPELCSPSTRTRTPPSSSSATTVWWATSKMCCRP